eukprot:scaffold101558_cov22-Tisochrysis_lutea.AAC.1
MSSTTDARLEGATGPCSCLQPHNTCKVGLVGVSAGQSPAPLTLRLIHQKGAGFEHAPAARTQCLPLIRSPCYWRTTCMWLFKK